MTVEQVYFTIEQQVPTVTIFQPKPTWWRPMLCTDWRKPEPTLDFLVEVKDVLAERDGHDRPWRIVRHFRRRPAPPHNPDEKQVVWTSEESLGANEG